MKGDAECVLREMRLLLSPVIQRQTLGLVPRFRPQRLSGAQNGANAGFYYPVTRLNFLWQDEDNSELPVGGDEDRFSLPVRG